MKAVAIGGSNGILINTRNRYWKNALQIALEQHAAGWWSTGLPESPVIHELGHAIHAEISPDKFDRGKSQFQYSSWKEIAGRVSRYAQRTSNEFVAEVFAGTVLGEKYDDDVMRIYKELGGPF